jgi:integrase
MKPIPAKPSDWTCAEHSLRRTLRTRLSQHQPAHIRRYVGDQQLGHDDEFSADGGPASGEEGTE